MARKADGQEGDLLAEEQDTKDFQAASVDFALDSARQDFRWFDEACETLDKKSTTFLGFASGVLVLFARFGPEVIDSAGQGLPRVLVGWTVALIELLLLGVLGCLIAGLWAYLYTYPKGLQVCGREMLVRKDVLLKYKYILTLKEVMPDVEAANKRKAALFQWSIVLIGIVIVLSVVVGLLALAFKHSCNHLR